MGSLGGGWDPGSARVNLLAGVLTGAELVAVFVRVGRGSGKRRRLGRVCGCRRGWVGVHVCVGGGGLVSMEAGAEVDAPDGVYTEL